MTAHLIDQHRLKL